MVDKKNIALSALAIDANEKNSLSNEQIALGALACHLSVNNSNLNIALSSLALHLNNNSINKTLALVAVAIYLEQRGGNLNIDGANNKNIALAALSLYLSNENTSANVKTQNQGVVLQQNQWSAKYQMMRQVPNRIPGVRPYSNCKRI